MVPINLINNDSQTIMILKLITIQLVLVEYQVTSVQGEWSDRGMEYHRVNAEPGEWSTRCMEYQVDGVSGE